MENKPKEIKDLENKGYIELYKDQIEKYIRIDEDNASIYYFTYSGYHTGYNEVHFGFKQIDNYYYYNDDLKIYFDIRVITEDSDTEYVYNGELSKCQKSNFDIYAEIYNNIRETNNDMMCVSEYINNHNFNRPIEVVVKIDSLEFFRRDLKPQSLLVGEPIFFGDNFDEVKFIKESLITIDGTLCEIKTEPGKLYLDDIYEFYLKGILKCERPNDEYDTFYPTLGMDFDDIKRNGWIVKYNLDFTVPSYEEFKNNLGDYMDFIRSLNKK